MSDISYKEIAEKVNNDISDLLKHKSEIVNHVIGTHVGQTTAR